VIASLGATLHDGERLGAVAAGFVLLTAIIGPVLARFSDRLTPKPAAGAASVPAESGTTT
jgi:hypothetical protein